MIFLVWSNDDQGRSLWLWLSVKGQRFTSPQPRRGSLSTTTKNTSGTTSYSVLSKRPRIVEHRFSAFWLRSSVAVSTKLISMVVLIIRHASVALNIVRGIISCGIDLFIVCGRKPNRYIWRIYGEIVYLTDFFK